MELKPGSPAGVGRKIGVLKKMFRYCPACASERIVFERCRVFRCPDCGFTYYHNTAAAAACIVKTAAGLVFLVRAKDPGKGRLDLPGGFVDPGEGAMEGLRRELIEEIGWDPGPLSGAGGRPCPLVASFPNQYPYKNIPYNTCDLFFFLDAPELTGDQLTIEAGEVDRVRFIRPGDLDMEELAFGSVKRALRAYLDLDL
ncbi:MAG: NUDIX domain-containing protein [Spirochaetaceae bacterium]|jgi:8-oxo-dGTP pyrophosphatase MutT (NUDIX family)|nr:NUDIX domain-containing protein [Spirochaetaceae bacterium]